MPAPLALIMDLPFDLDAEVVRLITSKSIELPTYPGVALKLQRVISSGNYGLGELAKLVESDQALATAVLRTANSAFYGAAAPLTTLPLAIGRVGANSLNNIAIAGTLGAQSSAEGPLASLRKDSWRRSLISALFNRFCSSVIRDASAWSASLRCASSAFVCWRASSSVDVCR